MATRNPLERAVEVLRGRGAPADPNTDNPYFQEFAAQGQNLFQAAGDSGKWTSSSEIYPADDVYITSVGGTDPEHYLGAGGCGGVGRRLGWMVVAASRRTTTRFHPGRRAAANGCSSRSKTYRQTARMSSANANFTCSTSVPIRRRGHHANEYFGGRIPALRLPCGPAIWRW